MVRGIVRLTFFTLFSLAVYGGTIVDIRDKNGRDSQFLSDDQMARLNTTDRKTYILMDYAKQSVKVVRSDRLEVLDLSGKIPSFGFDGSAPDKTALRIEAEGDGPEVAGYETQQYKLSRNGEYCGTVFASKQALEDTGTGQTFRTLQKMADKLANGLASLLFAMNPCQRAMTNTLDQVISIGAPLRSLDQKGKVDVEITQIQTGVGLPSDTFVIPNNYKIVTAEQQMQRVELKIRDGMQNLLKNPGMKKILEGLIKRQN
ncbi:MAG: hypothetical protein L0Y39_08475 [Methylococcaceae bacterium]|nr:hypothetical protein [Methylococcaceae bacterium]